MVVKVIKWRPWSPLHSNKYQATITVRCLKGLHRPFVGDRCGDGGLCSPPLDGGVGMGGGLTRLTVEIRWKGPKGNGIKAFRRSLKKNYTREEALVLETGVVRWDEEFQCDCRFSGHKKRPFHPWEVAFSIFNASDQRTKSRVMIAGPAVLNLADFVSYDDKQEVEIDIPLTISAGGLVFSPSLFLSVHLSELRANRESLEVVRRCSSMPLPAPLSPCFGSPLTFENDKHSTTKKSLKKVKSLTDYVSSRRKTKKAHHLEGGSDSKFLTGSEDFEYTCPFNTDSFDYSGEGVSEENMESDIVVQKSIQYRTLVSANLAWGGFNSRKNNEDEVLLYFSHRKPEVKGSYNGDLASEVPDQSLKLSPKLGVLWRKRKLSFRSRKVRGEPLLKKEYGESGGDDIDFVRRHLSSDGVFGWSSKTEEELLLLSEFGNDKFAVGSWECKEIVNRDGSMRLQTQVFFASIDQRHEKAAGGSACTALVVVIAHWLHSNGAIMLTRSEFDGLIREGSLQWRNLCGVEALMARFPDKHFDLETVLHAGIRPIHEVAEKSFIGFFHVDAMEEEGRLGFLQGAMSFDKIWDEIGRITSQSITKENDSLVYIVSWNDHFFVLKVDSDAYYIIDTLGERLFEGCNQAFMLKFDKDSQIERLPTQSSRVNEKPVSSSSSSSSSPPPSSLSSSLSLSPPSSEEVGPNSGVVGSAKLEVLSGGSHVLADGKNEKVEDMVVCRGKEACKEYIKSFLAAIPIRELQADIKRGLMASTIPLHQWLQIEFHHTDQFLLPATNPSAASEAAGTVAEGGVLPCNGSSALS